MARFYANENFPLPVVEALRQQGHDILTILETGLAGQAMSDEAYWPLLAQSSAWC